MRTHGHRKGYHTPETVVGGGGRIALEIYLMLNDELLGAVHQHGTCIRITNLHVVHIKILKLKV